MCNCRQACDCGSDSDAPRKNTLDEMIEVCKAVKEGQRLECRAISQPNAKWVDMFSEFQAAFDYCQYRVKKEPREIYYVWTEKGSRLSGFNSLEVAKSSSSPGYTICKMVQVGEEIKV